MSIMTEVRMPKLGESVTEGTVHRWLKTPGEVVALREPLLEISTDKIDTEIPSPSAGRLLEVLVAEGESVPVGTVLARIGTADTGADVESPKSDVGRRGAIPTEDRHDEDAPQEKTDPPSGVEEQSLSEKRAPAERPVAGRAYLSPVVQKMTAEHQIDLARVTGTGLGGRITKRDLLLYLDAEVADEATDSALIATAADITPLSSMRRAIAQHMSESVRTAPHVASIFEVDMSAVVRHRETERAAFAGRGVRLTYTAYVVHAVAQALGRHPRVNDCFTQEGIAHNSHIHIGVAVALGENGAEGLVVPVLRKADELTLAGIARALRELTDRARSGQLQPDDLYGGTFTITNHGVGGSLIGTPIIVQPQSAILGIGAIVKRAVVKSAGGSLLPSIDDAIVIRPMCYLTLSFDHRILDGAAADAFLRDVQSGLENWGGDR